jgi:GntR family transcriptional regulator
MSEPMPLYRKIAEDLRGQIKTGELAPGDRLKSEAELMEQYGQDGKASRNTIRDAIRLLVSRGLVETRAGQGTFVVKKMQPFLARLTLDPESGGLEDEVYRSEVQRQGREPEETPPRVEVQPATALVASRLAVEEGTPVISRHQERSIDGTPWSLQTIFYPMEFATEGGATALLVPHDMSARPGEGVLKYLESTLGVKQVGWRDMMIARPPRGQERGFFGLSDKTPVAIFESQRTSYGEDGKPIRFALTVYPADRNQFEMEAGRVPAPDTTTPDASASTGSSADWEDEPSGNGSPGR